MFTLQSTFQLGSLTVGSKQNGEVKEPAADVTSAKSGASTSTGAKSIKAVWKRFAFKATKGQHSSSLPPSVSLAKLMTGSNLFNVQSSDTSGLFSSDQDSSTLV